MLKTLFLLFIQIIKLVKVLSLFKFFIFVLLIAVAELISLGILVPVISAFLFELNHIQLFGFKLEVATQTILLIGLFWILRSVIFVGANYSVSMFIQTLKSKMQIKILENYSHSKTRLIQQETGELFTRITNDVQMIMGQIMTPLSLAISELAIVAVLFSLLIYSYTLGTAVVILSILVGFGLNYFLVLPFTGKLGTRRKHFERHWAYKVSGAINSRFEAQVFKVSDEAQADITGFVWQSNKATGIFYSLTPFTRSLLEFSAITGLIIALYIGVLMEVEQPIVIFFLLAVARMIPSMSRIAYAISTIKFSVSVADELTHELSASPVDKNLDTTGSDPYFLDNKVFIPSDRNSDRNEALCINLLEPQLTAIAGPSGAGKTTLIKKICRLVYSEASETLRLGYVGQDNAIIEGDIKQNIRFYRSHLSEKEIINSIKPVGLDDETLLSMADCEVLSGGEKRRVCFARAIVDAPDVLILDEATASLDRKRQLELMNLLKKTAVGTCIIMITHTMDELNYADRVINLGEIK